MTIQPTKTCPRCKCKARRVVAIIHHVGRVTPVAVPCDRCHGLGVVHRDAPEPVFIHKAVWPAKPAKKERFKPTLVVSNAQPGDVA